MPMVSLMAEQEKDVKQLIHDVRGPLNKISMNAELVKLVIENDLPREKALAALDKIIQDCQVCSQHLQQIAETK